MNTQMSVWSLSPFLQDNQRSFWCSNSYLFIQSWDIKLTVAEVSEDVHTPIP